MVETLTNITWPGAFAVVGSVIAIVTGLLALALNYMKARSTLNGNAALKSQLPSMEGSQIHSRISELRDRVGTVDSELKSKISAIEGEQKVLVVKIENVTQRLEDHDSRDVDDFRVINKKVDKLMEIIVEMLKGDH
jgi:hypothetical protein